MCIRDSVWRTYGGKLAAGVLPRMVLSCIVNLAATTAAFWTYAAARRSRKRQRWLKTEHHFPEAASSLARLVTGAYDGGSPTVGTKTMTAPAGSGLDYNVDSRFHGGD